MKTIKNNTGFGYIIDSQKNIICKYKGNAKEIYISDNEFFIELASIEELNAIELTDTRTVLVVKEDKLKGLRIQRNALLKDSDWTQMPDAPLTLMEKEAWATYRQALRDIPNVTTTAVDKMKSKDKIKAHEVVWPAIPVKPVI